IFHASQRSFWLGVSMTPPVPTGYTNSLYQVGERTWNRLCVRFRGRCGALDESQEQHQPYTKRNRNKMENLDSYRNSLRNFEWLACGSEGFQNVKNGNKQRFASVVMM
ncbi:unnamed protein product, partial [Amoebophrya sp. A25]